MMTGGGVHDFVRSREPKAGRKQAISGRLSWLLMEWKINSHTLFYIGSDANFEAAKRWELDSKKKRFNMNDKGSSRERVVVTCCRCWLHGRGRHMTA